jgi:hypothetical protein
MVSDRKHRVKECHAFLDALWPSPPEDARLVLWTLPSKAVTLCEDAAEAARQAVTLCDAGQEVYFGVSAVRADLDAGRGKREDMRWLPAVALDVDVAAEGRGKTKLFESLDAAGRFLAELPLRPSLVVASGAGLQAWWVLREPIDLQEDATHAASLTLGWNSFVRARALAAGSELDAVHDLTRVLRVPGTLNRKYGDERPVRLLVCDPARYNPSDFEPYVVEARQSLAGVIVGDLVLSAGANPPLEKFMALRENDKRFAQTYDRTRADLRGKSDSEWDMSLASQTVIAGWSDQEIADLLIAHRRQHGGPPKLREDYYARTIRRARETHVAATIGAEISTGVVDTSTEEGKAKVLAAFSVQTGARIVGVYRYLPEGDRLSFAFGDGRSEFYCTLQELCDWPTFWRKLSAAGFLPHTARPKQPEWLGMVNALQSVAEERQVDGGGKTALVAYYAAMLGQRSGIDVEPGTKDSDEPTRARAVQSFGAFIRGGSLWVRPRGISAITEENRRPMSLTEVEHHLLAAGAEKRQFTARLPGGKQVNGMFFGLRLDRVAELAGLATPTDTEPEVVS